MAAPDVAFCRTLLPGARGGDVIAHKRALSHAAPDLYPWAQFSNYYGPIFTNAVKAYQRKHALAADGQIGPKTHALLQAAHRVGHPSEWAFDSVAIADAKAFCAQFAKTPEDKIREAGVAAGWYWYQHRSAIAYSQYRPFWIGKPPGVPARLDCSAFATDCHYAGGARNPNRRQWDGQGYTGTLMGGGTRVGSLSQLKPLDLIFYYRTQAWEVSPAFPLGSPKHVAVYVGLVNGMHAVLSMGGYPMGLYPWNYAEVNCMVTYNVVPLA